MIILIVIYLLIGIGITLFLYRMDKREYYENLSKQYWKEFPFRRSLGMYLGTVILWPFVLLIVIEI